MRIALAGNPNSGKTTLLNRLTGMRQRVGNFPGVTVERVEGALRADESVTLIDLPGVYALDAAEGEEAVARETLAREKLDAVINVLDATSMARGLYLTLELKATGLPVLVALTMLDELPEKGKEINLPELERELGLPVVAAQKLPAALKKLRPNSKAQNREVQEPQVPARGMGTAPPTSPPSPRQRADSVPQNREVQEPQVPAGGMGAAPPTFSSSPRQRVYSSPKNREVQEPQVPARGMGAAPPSSSSSSSLLYARADSVVSHVMRGAGETAARKRSRRADAVLMHPAWALPTFGAVMAGILYLTFGPVGGAAGEWLGAAVETAFGALDGALKGAKAPEWLCSLLSEGILNGLGAVLGFLPSVLTLFFLLSLVEDSGYMARMACCADRLFRRLGLNGRAFVPALLGFGCTVPAILATRTLPDARDRRRMTLLLPFCSCSAKLPVYSLFAAAFFPGKEVLAVGALYALGALLMLPAAFCMSRLAPGEESTFLLELPSYRMPSAKAALSLMLRRAQIFLRCALTTLLPASVLIWLLNRIELSGVSLLQIVSGAVAPAFAPAGFGMWQAAAALLCGLAAKEGILSTFVVLLRAPGTFALRAALRRVFTPLTAASFLTFTLLYTPCAAALGAARRELGGWKAALGAAICQSGIAYIAACVVYNAGRLLGCI